MPLTWLVNYWKKAGKYTLPFLQHRKIALQQKFDDQIIYRRHNEKKEWIYVQNQSQLNKYVFGHTYSFHPHQLSDDNILWILIDIDKRNDRLPFSYIVEVAKIMAAMLERDRQPYLLKFSGNRGFHFMWSMGKIKSQDLKSGLIYQKEQQIVMSYAAKLEEYFQHYPRAKALKKYYPANSPIFSTNSADKKLSHCILIDKNILRPNAVFRSPWSVHPKTNLVSAPISVSDLDNFDKKNFQPENIIAKLHQAEIPK